MLINRQNKHFSITCDNGVTIFNEEIQDKKNNVCILLENLSVQLKEAFSIFNPGEYEIFGVIMKISKYNNIQISNEGIKVTIVNDADKVLKSDNVDNSDDILLFDYSDKTKIDLEKIIQLVKTVQPKILIINSEILLPDSTTYEKITKLKIKKSELDSILDTKMYIL